MRKFVRRLVAAGGCSGRRTTVATADELREDMVEWMERIKTGSPHAPQRHLPLHALLLEMKTQCADDGCAPPGKFGSFLNEVSRDYPTIPLIKYEAFEGEFTLLHAVHSAANTDGGCADPINRGIIKHHFEALYNLMVACRCRAHVCVARVRRSAQDGAPHRTAVHAS